MRAKRATSDSVWKKKKKKKIGYAAKVLTKCLKREKKKYSLIFSLLSIMKKEIFEIQYLNGIVKMDS
jgi:hypothetical protein